MIDAKDFLKIQEEIAKMVKHIETKLLDMYDKKEPYKIDTYEIESSIRDVVEKQVLKILHGKHWIGKFDVTTMTNRDGSHLEDEVYHHITVTIRN